MTAPRLPEASDIADTTNLEPVAIAATPTWYSGHHDSWDRIDPPDGPMVGGVTEITLSHGHMLLTDGTPFALVNTRTTAASSGFAFSQDRLLEMIDQIRAPVTDAIRQALGRGGLHHWQPTPAGPGVSPVLLARSESTSLHIGELADVTFVAVTLGWTEPIRFERMPIDAFIALPAARIGGENPAA